MSSSSSSSSSDVLLDVEFIRNEIIKQIKLNTFAKGDSFLADMERLLDSRIKFVCINERRYAVDSFNNGSYIHEGESEQPLINRASIAGYFRSPVGFIFRFHATSSEEIKCEVLHDIGNVSNSLLVKGLVYYEPAQFLLRRVSEEREFMSRLEPELSQIAKSLSARLPTRPDRVMIVSARIRNDSNGDQHRECFRVGIAEDCWGAGWMLNPLLVAESSDFLKMIQPEIEEFIQVRYRGFRFLSWDQQINIEPNARIPIDIRIDSSWKDNVEARAKQLVQHTKQVVQSSSSDSPKYFLYHISRAGQCGYDEYSDAVVIATSEAEARSIHPQEEHYVFKTEEWDGSGTMTWVEASSVIVEEIGVFTGVYSKEKRVICASFRAG